MNSFQEKTILLREDLIKEYSPFVSKDILEGYGIHETRIIVNDEDRNLYPIPLSLPNPPPYHLIDGFGLPAVEQYFRRPKLPKKISDLIKRLGMSASISDVWEAMEKNKIFFKDELRWINLQWKYRLEGYWFFNNGLPTYIDGWHWLYLAWWQLDSGFPEYRYRDKIFYLFARYCYTTTVAPFFYRVWFDDEYKYFSKRGQADKFIQDNGLLQQPESGEFMVDFGFRTCYGFNYPKHRREGATYKAALINYEITSRKLSSIGGIQSKDEESAKKDVYEKKIINPFKRLPFFFKPIYKNAYTNSLVFDKTASGANNGGFIDGGGGLESEISYRPSSERAYDGTRLCFYHGDEVGKPAGKPFNLIERWEVVYKTLGQGADIDGLAIHTSTVSDTVGDSGRNYMMLCKASKYEERSNVSGLTKSGLLNLFVNSLVNLGGLSDQYGNPIISKPTPEQKKFTNKSYGAKEFLDNKLQEKSNDPIAYYETRREYPLQFSDCFLSAGKDSGFNLKILNERMSELDFTPELKPRVGDFSWVDKFGGNVKFTDNPDGKFILSYIPATPNKFVTKNGKKCPANTHLFVMGTDAFKFENVKGGKKSNGAGCVFLKHDPILDPPEKDTRLWTTGRTVCTYNNRVEFKETYKEDMLMMAIFFGVKAFPESNENAIHEYFTLHGFTEYLQYRFTNGIPEPNSGYFATNEFKQRIFGAIMDYVHNHGYAERHRELLQEIYDIRGLDDMTNFDLFAAFGGCMLAIYYENLAKPTTVLEEGEIDPMVAYIQGIY